MKRNLALCLLLLTTTGCLSQSQIQSKYMSQQNECRADVSRYMSGLATTESAAGTNPAGTYFNECMNKAGWRVALPKNPQTASNGPAPNPPTGSPSTNPSAATAVAPRQIPAENPNGSAAWSTQAPTAAPAAPVKQPVASANPPTGAPSVNPSAAVAKVPASQARVTPAQPVNKALSLSGVAPAQYAPARPPLVQNPAYGSGAGRQF